RSSAASLTKIMSGMFSTIDSRKTRASSVPGSSTQRLPTQNPTSSADRPCARAPRMERHPDIDHVRRTDMKKLMSVAAALALDDDTKKQNTALAKKHAIKGYPTIVFLDAEGKEIGRTGYVKGGPAAWLKAADAVLAKKADGQEEAVGKKDAGAKGDSSWVESYDDAVARAKKANRLVLADFTGSDWCGWCIKLREEVFDTKEF